MNNNEIAVREAERLPNSGLLVNLGPQRRKKIARLKAGDGALARHIHRLVGESRKELGIDDATEIVPVVMIYRCDDPDYSVVVV